MDNQPSPTPNPERIPAPPVPDQLIGAGRHEPSPRPAAPEQAPRAAEQAPQPQATPATAPPPTVAQPVTPPSPLTADDVAKAIAASPMPAAPVVAVPQTAADQDVVEPEWVNAAEQAIAGTAGNPYAEEEAVESLQVDYLKKRYGHEVKKPEDK